MSWATPFILTFLDTHERSMFIQPQADNDKILYYSIVRLDRNRCGGGVVLYIKKNNSPYVERQDLVSDDFEII